MLYYGVELIDEESEITRNQFFEKSPTVGLRVKRMMHNPFHPKT